MWAGVRNFMLMKKGLYIFFCFLTATVSFGQKSLDSLENKLANASDDSVRFQILMKLSEESEFYDYSKCRKYAEEASVVAERINSYRLKGYLYFRLAFLENVEGDYSDALRYHQQLINLYVANKDSSANLCRALMNVGRDYLDLGEYEDGYYYLTQSFKVAKSHNKVPQPADSLVMAIALHNIGDVFLQLGRFDIALKHIEASQVISENIHDTEAPAYNYSVLGELFRRKKDYDQSEEYLLSSLAEARKHKIRVLIPRIQSSLARLYLDKKEFERSLMYYDSVITHETKINNRFMLAECNLGKGMVMSRSGNYAEAQQYYALSLKTSRELNARILEVTCYNELADLYEVKRDFQNSLLYHKQHDALRDSLFSETIMEKLSQNQIRFETENKDMVIAALNHTQEQQNAELRRQELVRNVLVIIVALTIVILFTVYRSGQRRKRINRLLLDHQEEIKKRSAELEQLNQVKDKFFSIISHDLRSPMNALAGTLELLSNKHLTTEEFLHLTGNLRTQFNHTRTLINNLLNWTLMQMDKLKIQPEKVFVRNKVDESFSALKTLYPKTIDMSNEVGENLAVLADPNIINLVLRNLILNAIKFTENGGIIHVRAKEIENEVCISVSDNGMGIRPEVKELLFVKASALSTRGTDNERGTGIGLLLCKEFVEKNGGRIWFESEVGKGTTFYFTLPIAA